MKIKQQQKSRNNTEAKTHEKTSRTSEDSKTMQHPKTVQEASEGGQLEKLELLSVITSIEETMKTLTTYGKQLKSHLEINLIQTEI